jgi:hypothetical protein
LFASLSLSLAACAAESGKADLDDDFSDLADTDQKSDAFSHRMKIVGDLIYGQTSAPIDYRRPPRYRALKFPGYGGDVIDVWVRSATGDAVAWVLDDDFRVIAANDDADGYTFDARIHVTLPAHASKTHYIVLRDFWLDPATFVVSLDGESDASCDRDADCAAFEVEDGRVALCDIDSHTCEGVLPGDIACGGRTLNPHECPAGWLCRGDGLPVDVPGRCYQFCGGFGNLPCPDGASCAEDPWDDCDPATGGADCDGICLPE